MDPLTAAAVAWAVLTVASFTATVAALALCDPDAPSASLGVAMVASWAAFAPLAAAGPLLGAVATLITRDCPLRRAVHGLAAVCLVGPTVALTYAAAPFAALLRALRRSRVRQQDEMNGANLRQ